MKQTSSSQGESGGTSDTVPARPVSPHIGIYRWQVQMVTSILHRATGVALAAGTLLVLAMLLALADGPESYARVRAFCASWLGTVLLVGWVWSLCYHLLNGIRHLWQDIGHGWTIPQFVRNSWIAVIGSLLLTVIVCWFAWFGGAP